MPFIQANGIQLYYEIKGNGVPLLIISGTGSDLRHQRPKDPPLMDFQVLRYDQRGLGQSDKPDTFYSMADYADDAEALLDKLGITQTNVLGISFGGMVAQHLVIRHPKRVNRLVLACTSPGGNNYSSYDLRQIADDESNKIESWLSILDSRYKNSFEPLPIINGIKDYLLASNQVFPNSVDGGLRRQLEARSGHDCTENLRRITHETLIAGGKYDMIAPERNLAEMHRLIKYSNLKIFEGGHLFLIQDKSAWPEIISFLLSESDTLKE